MAEAVKLIPGYEQKSIAALKERSAMNWPDAVNVPLLMFHGASDDEVPAAEALTFAAKFSALKRPYEIVVYWGDVHEVALNRLERIRELPFGSSATFVRSSLTSPTPEWRQL